MIKRKIVGKVGYLEFSIALRKSDFKYTEQEIRQLFLSVRAMDEESRGWVINWINGDGLPQEVVEDVTAKYLVEKCGMQPINAIIALDWLKAEPRMAKLYILKYQGLDSDPEPMSSELRTMMEKVGANFHTSEENKNVEKMTIEGVVQAG